MAQSNDDEIPLHVTLLNFVVNGYGFLLTIAAGGLICANIFGMLGHAVNILGKLELSRQHLMHGGWLLGVLAAGVGGAIKWWKTKPIVIPHKSSRSELEEPQGTRHGVLGSMFWCGVIGTVLGVMLGLSFVLLWFSVAYSPIAPESWVKSIKTVEHRRPNGRREHGVSSNHPMLWYAFGIPVGLGTVSGLACGAFVPVHSLDETGDGACP